MINGIVAGQSMQFDVVFDPALASGSSNFTFTDGNATAEVTSALHQYLTASSNTKTAGKWQFEVQSITKVASQLRPGVMGGSVPAGASAFGLGESTSNYPHASYNTWGRRVYWALTAGQTSYLYDTAGAAGVTITVALDLDLATPEVSFYQNGVFVYTKALEAGTAWRPAVSAAGIGEKFTIRGHSLLYPVPGFSSWGIT